MELYFPGSCVKIPVAGEEAGSICHLRLGEGINVPEQLQTTSFHQCNPFSRSKGAIKTPEMQRSGEQPSPSFTNSVVYKRVSALVIHFSGFICHSLMSQLGQILGQLG